MNRNQKVLMLILTGVLSVSLWVVPVLGPVVNGRIYGNRTGEVQAEALGANLMMVRLTRSFGHNSVSTEVSSGASGVVFHKEGNRYYVLTAAHNLGEEADTEEIRILHSDEPELQEYMRAGGTFQGVVEYYRQFPVAVLQYLDEGCDLAVLSFESERDFQILPVAEDPPGAGEIVVAMGNPLGRRNLVTAGRIRGRKNIAFGDGSGQEPQTLMIHTAWTGEGSSGSALLNSELEIVGICLGGNENLIRKYVSGIAVPAERIQRFLHNWRLHGSAGE